ncbi:MAG: hypothetical protein PHV17_05060 [Candidatus Omnitrophica bacterium]|nr:hypothetical protein [Candidatus Omnitrophota bacterium]
MANNFYRYFMAAVLVMIFSSNLIKFTALCETAQPALVLDETKEEVVFARKVETAVKKNRESFFSLVLARPPEKEKQLLWIHSTLWKIIKSEGKLAAVEPANPKTAMLFSDVCRNPYTAVFKNKKSSISLPVGKVEGAWKILIKNH